MNIFKLNHQFIKSIKNLKIIDKFKLQRKHFSNKLSQEEQKRRDELMRKGLPKKKPIQGVKDIIIVASGKGGVGKSTTTVNLALALKKLNSNNKIGILDADLFGPTIPLLMNLREKPLANQSQKIIPLQNFDLKCMSIGFLIKKEDAVIWRGLMVMQAIEKLTYGVDWGELDYLLIDTPPGTSDTHLTLLQTLPISGIILISTPQQPSVEVTMRSVSLYQKMKVNIFGVVENMSSSNKANENNDFEKRVEQFQLKYNIDLLGSIPMNSQIALGCDEGKPIVVINPDSSISQKYIDIAKKIQSILESKKEVKISQ